MVARAIPLPINIGSQPNWNTRLGNPSLLNMYVGDNGNYCLPTLVVAALQKFIGLRAVHYSPYPVGGGTYYAVDSDAIYRVTTAGAVSLVKEITPSGAPVKIDENLQNQITIVDGITGYVIGQSTPSFTPLTSSGVPGILAGNMVGVVVINTYTIILYSNGIFQVSSPNNSLLWNNPVSTAQMESILTTGVGLVSLDNNLYIIGSTGIERWEAFNTNDYAFPFVRDNNFRSDYGALSAASIALGIDEFYFLSSKYVPVAISLDGQRELSDSQDASSGLARQLGSYANPQNAYGAFYSNKGVYFYQLSFLESAKGWVYTIKNKKWQNTDDLIVASTKDTEPNQLVATSTQLFRFSSVPIVGSYKRRVLRTPRIVTYQGQVPYRSIVNKIEARIVQGNLQFLSNDVNQNPNNQILTLSLSLDSLNFGNLVPAPIGLTGQTQAVTQWNCNVPVQEITAELSYYGDLDFCISELILYVT